MYYDLLKAPTWSFMLGSGLAPNSTRGILGTGGMPDNGVSNNDSEYINQYGIGFIFSAGFRPNKEAKKLTWNFLPFNAIIGPNYYL